MMATSPVGAIDVNNGEFQLRMDAARRKNGVRGPQRREFRAVLYSHDTMGLGHLRRNQLIALAIRQAVPESRILLIAGIQQATSIEFPSGIDCLTLPSLAKSIGGVYGARSLDMPVEQVAHLRGASIHGAVESFDPDLFIADKAPRGVCGELDATLKWLDQRGRARRVLGLRDVLDEPAAVERDWRQGDHERWINDYYDECWVYGDKSVYNLADEYAWPSRIAAKLKYLGYLDQRFRLASSQGIDGQIRGELGLGNERLAVCTLGGGQDGFPLGAAFAAARMPAGYVGVLLTGPFLLRHQRRELELLAADHRQFRVVEFLPEADRLVAQADRLITMGGYNSVCAALSFGKPALVAPRVVPRREQWIRAERLADRGLVDVLTPQNTDPDAISTWLAGPGRTSPRAADLVDLSGLERLAASAARLSSQPLRVNMRKLPASNDVSCGDEPPLRVGYVLKRYPRFSETFIVNEILAHERAGVEIDIFSLRPTTDSHFQDKLSQVRAGVAYLPEGSCRASDLWSIVRQVAKEFPQVWPVIESAAVEGTAIADLHHALTLAPMLRRRGIQHLHAHFATSAAEVARLASAITGIPYSLTAHAKDIFHDEVSDADLGRKIAAASRVVTVSDFNLHYLQEKFPVSANQIVRIFNGLDLEDFPFHSPAHRPPRILAVGRLIEKKGFADLIASCGILAARGIACDCEIIGEGELADQLAQQIDTLGIGSRVRLLGPKCRAEVVRLMQHSAVMVAPCVVGNDGNRDGLPTVLLEAMALGTPCISTNVTGIPELIRHNETGVLVNQRSPEDLAEAIAQMLVDSQLRTTVALAARQLIEEQFDVHRNAASQREIFLASRSNGPAPFRELVEAV